MANIQYQNLPISLTGSVDTKSDKKSIPPTKLALLENGTHTAPGAVAKRHGYSALNSSVALIGTDQDLTAIRDAHTHSTSLFLTADRTATVGSNRDKGRMFSFSSGIDRWIDLGRHQNIEYSVEHVSTTDSGYDGAMKASLGDLDLYVWEGDGAGAFASLRDRETGANLFDNLIPTYPSGGTNPKVAAADGVFFVFWRESPATIKYIIIDPDTPLEPSSAVSAITDLNASALWDIQVLNNSSGVPSKVVLAYENTGNQIVLRGYTSAGYNSQTHTLAVNPMECLSMNRLADSTGGFDLVVMYVNTTDSIVRFYSLIFGTFSSGSHSTTIDASGFTVQNITAALETVADTDQIRFFIEHEIGGSLHGYEALRYIQCPRVSTLGVSASDSYAQYKTGLATKAFTHQGYAYAVVVHQGLTAGQNTYFLWTPTPHYQNVTLQTETRSPSTDAIMLYGQAYGYSYRAGAIQSPCKLDSNTYTFAVTRIAVLLDDDEVEYDTTGITFSFDQSGYQSASLGDSAYVANGTLQLMDSRIQETGFLLNPDKLGESTKFTTAGSMSNGTYSYMAIYEWTDRNGQIHWSGPSPALSVSMTGGTSTQRVTIRVPYLNFIHANKETTKLVVYRTQNNGTTYYRTSMESTNVPSLATVEVIDSVSDADLANNQIIYFQSPTSTSDIENEPPPACKLLVAGENRLFAVPMDNRKKLLYSKVFETETAVAWSNELSVDLADLKSEITALTIMDEKLIIFTESEIKMIPVAAFDSVGFNVISIPSDVGCASSRSLVLTHLGLFFKSNKGIYALDRGLNSVYIGADVESYNSDDIYSATLVSSGNQVRFVTSSGVCLVYQYNVPSPDGQPEPGRWSVFTNHSAIDAEVWNGQFCLFMSNGTVLGEEDTLFTDNGTSYSLRLKTGWIKPGGLQGYVRSRRAVFLGERVTNSIITVNVRYDYSETIAQTEIFDLSSVMDSSDELMMLRFRLDRQKFTAIQFEITETDSSGTEEAISLTELALEVGLIPGHHRLPARKTQ